jgi:MerR family mercuric resistance operon transcriptional regulator
MADEMTIGALAKATGVPPATIRFYERQALLQPQSRSVGNYRLYGRAAAERLTFIGAAQAAGLALPEIRAVLALETGRTPCGVAAEIVAARPGTLREQMLKLRQLERVLQKVERACAGKPKDAPCVVSDPFVLRRWLRRT